MKKILFDGILICARQKKQSSKYISVAACFVTLPAFLPWFSKLKDKFRNRKGTKKIKKLIISIWNFLYFLLEKKWWKKLYCYPQVSARACRVQTGIVHMLVHMCTRYARAWPGENRNNGISTNSTCTPFFSPLHFPFLFRNISYYFSYVPLVLIRRTWNPKPGDDSY